MRIVIKGAGDLATGIACRLFVCGYEVIMSETSIPTTVRRTVAFSRAIYENCAEVEGISGKLARTSLEVADILCEKKVAIIVDPNMDYKEDYAADVLVDAILAKRNLGTKIDDAKLVIGVGPGFSAGDDCHCVVESNRGHSLGRVIYKGCAEENTGVPGVVMGYSIERIIRSGCEGEFKPIAEIGEIVKKGDVVAYCADTPIYALMDGMVRGMLQYGVYVTKGMKCGDIDARCDKESIFTVSDKARSIGGAVLEAIVAWENKA